MLAFCVLSELDSSIDTWICKGEEKKRVVTATSMEKGQKYIKMVYPVHVFASLWSLRRGGLTYAVLLL